MGRAAQPHMAGSNPGTMGIRQPRAQRCQHQPRVTQPSVAPSASLCSRTLCFPQSRLHPATMLPPGPLAGRPVRSKAGTTTLLYEEGSGLSGSDSVQQRNSPYLSLMSPGRLFH